MSSLSPHSIVFCVLALTLRVVAADPLPTLDSLRAEHLAHAAALTSLVVEEEVTADYTAAGLDDRVREHLEQRMSGRQARCEAGRDCAEISAEGR